MKQTLGWTLALAAIISLSAVVFNHVSPWAGIGVCVVGAALVAAKIDKYVNKENEIEK